MAASGAAFRQRFDACGWNMGASDIRFIYKEPFKPFELAFKSAGRSYMIYEERDKSKTKDTYLKVIKSELDCGRPLIALGVVGPPEACIVTGYQNGGSTLLGWSLFQGDGPFDETWKFMKQVILSGKTGGKTPKPLCQSVKKSARSHR